MAKLSNISNPTPISPPTQRKSYLLSVTPVDYSLTDGTNIPAPEQPSPPRSPAPEIARPPTPGRGPLNSHPATPDEFPDLQPDMMAPPPQREKENIMPAPTHRTTTGSADSFRTPSSPASAAQHTSPQQYQQQARRPSGVRKLLSISNLRSSFSSSRTSLAPQARPSTDDHAYSSYNNYTTSSLKRPSSPSMASTTASTIQTQPQPQPRLRERKSNGSWLRRKSALFLPLSSNNNGDLDAVEEVRPDTRESKRVKGSQEGFTGGYNQQFGQRQRQESILLEQEQQSVRSRSPPPLIPEIGRGSFSGGDLGWDEGSFRR